MRMPHQLVHCIDDQSEAWRIDYTVMAQRIAHRVDAANRQVMPYISIERHVLADEIAHFRMWREQHRTAAFAAREKDRRFTCHVANEPFAIEWVVDREARWQAQ